MNNERKQLIETYNARFGDLAEHSTEFLMNISIGELRVLAHRDSEDIYR